MSTKPQDAKHMPLSDVDRLCQDAQAAAEVRSLQTHPDVVALRVERVRTQVDRLMWVGLLLGLGFTMVNVQTFAAAGAAVWSLAWCAAWLLDPMVSIVLVAVLRAEQVTARYRVDTGGWVRATKLFAFAATYTMNTWQSWSHGHLSGIVLHSVPPAMVYLVAETGPILRDRLTEAVLRAAQDVARQTTPGSVTPAADTAAPASAAGSPQDTGNSTQRRVSRSRKSAAKPRAGKRRTSREEYLSRARAAYRPGVVVTPAWVRQAVPDISRGTSQVVADALNTELADHHTTTASTTPTTAPVADQPAEQGRAA